MAVERWSGDDVDAIVTAADLTAKEGYFVTLGASGLSPTGAALRADGIVIEGNGVGLNSTFMHNLGRIAKVKLAGTVAMGGLVASNAAGLGVAATTGQLANGVAREGGVSGQLISIFFKHVVAP